VPDDGRRDLDQLGSLGYGEVVVDVGQWRGRSMDEMLADLSWFAQNLLDHAPG
jgi:hypothetical protein